MRTFATLADAQGASNKQNGESFEIGTGSDRWVYQYDSSNVTAAGSNLGDAVLDALNGAKFLLANGSRVEVLAILADVDGVAFTGPSGSSSAAIALPAAKRGYTIKCLTGDMIIRIGGGAVASSATGSRHLSAGESVDFRANSSQTHFAAFGVGGASTGHVTALD